MKDTYQEFASKVAGAWLEQPMSEGDMNKTEGMTRELISSPAFVGELMKIAAAAFEGTGRPGEFLFEKLASTPHSPAHELFGEVVLGAMGRMEKQALALATLAHDKLGGNMLKTLISAGVLGGAGAGSLAFLLNRNAVESSAENGQLLEKIRAFNEMKREIEEDERMREMEESTKKEVGSGRFSIR